MKKGTFEYSAVVLTGGSSGIGASFLASLLDLKQKVLICNLSRRKPEVFEREPDCYHFECDLSRAEAIEEVFLKIKELMKEQGGNGRILLINNSGFGSYGEFQESDLETQLNMIELNVCGMVHLTRLMLPLMMEWGGGAIINVASTAAFQPTPYMATYGATKSFVLNWSLAIREDLRKKNIRVLALCPGPTKTGFFKGAIAKDLKGVMYQTAREVVEVAWKALEADKGFVVSGFRNKVIVCIVKFLPLTLIARVSGMILRRIRS